MPRPTSFLRAVRVGMTQHTPRDCPVGYDLTGPRSTSLLRVARVGTAQAELIPRPSSFLCVARGGLQHTCNRGRPNRSHLTCPGQQFPVCGSEGLYRQYNSAAVRALHSPTAQQLPVCGAYRCGTANHTSGWASRVHSAGTRPTSFLCVARVGMEQLCQRRPLSGTIALAHGPPVCCVWRV